MRGSQEPRIKIEPPRASTDGGDAALLMSAYGYKLDPWQQAVVDCWLGCDEAGKYTMTSAGLALPRQNGKNVCLEAREFFGIEPGDTLLILGKHETGLIVTKPETLNDLATQIFQTVENEG